MDFFGYFISFILGVFSNYFYSRLQFKFRHKKGDQLPSILSDTKGWTTSNGEHYYYEKEPEYKIIINEPEDDLRDKYKKFPDREHDRIAWVEVKYNDVTLFGWNFMHLDGFRILIPVPKTEYSNEVDTDEDMYDYYDLSRPEFKVFEIIGQADLMGETSKIEGLKRIARILEITITD